MHISAANNEVKVEFNNDIIVIHCCFKFRLERHGTFASHPHRHRQPHIHPNLHPQPQTHPGRRRPGKGNKRKRKRKMNYIARYTQFLLKKHTQ